MSYIHIHIYAYKYIYIYIHIYTYIYNQLPGPVFATSGHFSEKCLALQQAMMLKSLSYWSQTEKIKSSKPFEKNVTKHLNASVSVVAVPFLGCIGLLIGGTFFWILVQPPAGLHNQPAFLAWFQASASLCNWGGVRTVPTETWPTIQGVNALHSALLAC